MWLDETRTYQVRMGRELIMGVKRDLSGGNWRCSYQGGKGTLSGRDKVAYQGGIRESYQEGMKRGLSGRNRLIREKMFIRRAIIVGMCVGLIMVDRDIFPNRGKNRRYLLTGRNREFPLKEKNKKIPLNIVQSLLKEK